MQALASGHKPQTAHAALTYVYYWYNFMPLARGTAVTGYITLLAIFLAADMPITSFIPKVRTPSCLFPKQHGYTSQRFAAFMHDVQAVHFAL